MAKSTLTRLGVSQWSADADTWPGRTGINAELSTLNSNAAKWGQGTTAARPVAGTTGFYYWATDTKRLWYDDGTVWTEVSPVGGGGTPVAETIGVAGAEGASRIAARADHVHALAVPGSDPATIAYGGSMNRGASATPARADHTHALPALPYAGSAPGALSYGVSGTAGASTNLARQDHSHTLPEKIIGSTDGNAFTSYAPGTAPAAAGNLQMFHIHTVKTANANGSVTIPLPFANGLQCVVLTCGDVTVGGPVQLGVYIPNTTPSSLEVLVAKGTDGSARPGSVRIMGMCWGW